MPRATGLAAVFSLPGIRFLSRGLFHAGADSGERAVPGPDEVAVAGSAARRLRTIEISNASQASRLRSGGVHWARSRTQTGDVHMQVQVNTDNNVDGREELARRVGAGIEAALSRFSDQITRVEAHLGDESAGRSSGGDKRCVLEARVEGRVPVAVTSHADTLDEAFRGAAEKLKRLLESEFGRQDDRKGGASIRGSQRRR